jgi:hypothetical protein
MAADIQRVEPEVNGAFLDKLELGTYALIYSNARYLMDGEPSNDLLALANEGAILRDQLLKDAEALSSRRIVDGKGLAEIQGVPGYKNIATDLSLLSVFLRENWPKIQGKSAIEFKEIERALFIAEAIFNTLGVREQGPTAEKSATDIRARAFTYLVNGYDKVRKAITFLRWDKRDWDQIAPSLYAGRSRKRSGGQEDEIETTTPPVVAPPVPATTASKPNGVAAAADNDPDVGTPDAQPFLK